MAVLPTGIGPVTGGYQIERSLRFNSADSAYLNRTVGAAATSNTLTTFSFWFKRSKLSTSQIIFSTNESSNVACYIELTTSDTLRIYLDKTAASSDETSWVTTAVFRDVSAWYHATIKIDASQASNSDKVVLYINNVSQTLTATQTGSAVSTQRILANGASLAIGKYTTAAYYGDFYLTEFYAIDGQALTPSDFGETDTNTGVWKPKAFSGTYGTNGFYLPFKTASQWSGYFDGNDSLSIPANAAFDFGTGDFTVEAWVYSPSTQSQYAAIAVNSNNPNGWYLSFSTSNVVTFSNYSTVALTSSSSISNNTWTHIAVSRSGTSLKMFFNGVQVASATNSTSYGATAGTNYIGFNGTLNYFLGYISNVRVVKGTAVYTSAFTPPTSQLTAITNTSLLTCQSATFVDNSTNAFTVTASGDTRPQQFSPFTLDVTDDHSGQGNHWIPNNLDLRTTGAGADILVDSPTAYGTDTGVGGEVRGNYATLNPLAMTGTYSNGNLDFTTAAADSTLISTIAVSSGKWYCEITPTAITANCQIGIVAATARNGFSPTNTNQHPSIVYVSNTGNKFINGTGTAYGATYTTNDVIGIALDLDNLTLQFYKNGTGQGSITGVTSGTYCFAVGDGDSVNTWSGVSNFGQRPFAYTAPSGFKALCTQNLPTPTIGATSTTQANDYFNVKTYTGTGTQQSLTGVGFQPDFIWFKSRSTAANHALIDAVRGRSKLLFSSLTDAEATSTTTAKDLVSFDADGFTVGVPEQNASINTNGTTNVAWNWKANGAGSSNTAGTITSTVSANTTSGFSIVTYTGNGTSGATIGHGLGVTPSMIIIKERSSSSFSWGVYHASIGNTAGVYLNLTNAAATTSVFWNNTSPTSSVFSVGNWGGVNGNTSTYVAYCFAPVADYSAFGSYTGNGSADGPFVYTNFRPAYVLVKRTNTTGNWQLFDSARDTYNVVDLRLEPNLSNAEASGTTAALLFADFLSNGFKIRGTDTDWNASGSTYIYAAFAENPFKYSLAR